MSEKFKLTLTKQCAKCPWKVSTNPYEIPGEYSKELHEKLGDIIPDPDPLKYTPVKELRVMGCHLSHKDYCIGYLHNQLNSGHNLALRLRFFKCENAKDIQIVGPQHKTFEDTLPKD
ncbi:hypothetical protein DBR11_04995 [Pedobacter sp. HMWF019]|uniref:hypothetical protein n=1 Tax=Pedobacter sp. HMWF019 TaxID=2056856 RepID=UPI000D38B02C|nr:hypothetical protein [Pedobacter sp. HMWF019]PTT02347.1 hypothetical protein DBR11_04995 [Pedobacter sp. HMWF019]